MDSKNDEKLITPYFEQIKNYLYGFVKDRELAKDLAQDVFLKALGKVRKDASKNEVKSFLYTIARNHALNFLAQQKHTLDVEKQNLQTETTEKADELKDKVYKILENLPPNYKKVLELKDFENYSYKDISVKLEISEAALTSLLNRARKEFKKQFLMSVAPKWAVAVSQENKNQELLEKIHPFAPQENFWNYLNQKTIDYFSLIYDKWDDIKDEFLKKEVISNLLEALELQGNEKILDIGCGVGKFVCEFPIFDYFCGIDLNLGLLKKTGNQTKNVDFVCGEMERLPIRSNSFDLLFCNLALHHAKNPQETLKEFERVLVKGGKLIILDFVKHKNPDFWERMRNIWLGFSPEELIKELKKIGMGNFSSFVNEKNNNYPEIFWIVANKK